MGFHQDDLIEDFRESNSATYCPEDNKLRLYLSARVERESFLHLRSCGYKSTPKQDCSFVATWSVRAEDAALELIADCDDIGDEDYSPQERAADRAERFANYRDKRRSEATGHADTYEAGPSAFGSQNAKRAERQAARHERHRGRALSQWSKAEYWQTRTAAVIDHAKYKSSAKVRRGRILKLESEQRKQQAGIKDACERRETLQRIAAMEGADELLPLNDGGYVDESKLNEAQRLAYRLVNSGRFHTSILHPTSEAANAKARETFSYWHGFSGYDLMTDDEFLGVPMERLTPKQFAELYLETFTDPMDPTTGAQRYGRHLELRLTYERAMLADQGGSASDCDMEPGGFIGGYQILRVNRSPATKRVTSVGVWGEHPWRTDGQGNPEMGIQTIKVERLGESIYRAPTEEERAAFAEELKAKRAEARKAAKGKPKTNAIVNPTEEDAQRLQDVLNARARAKHDEARAAGKIYRDFEPATIAKVTQKAYSAAAKGSYSRAETRTLHNAGGILSRRPTNLWSEHGAKFDKELGPQVCKVRTADSPSSVGWYTPVRIVVLTDKPQKPLPVDWEAIERQTETAAAE